MQFVAGLFVAWFVCYVLHKISDFFDFSMPQIQEARCKKEAKEKYNIEKPSELINVKSKNLEELERRAKSFADRVTLTPDNMPEHIRQEVWQTNYSYYYNKYKNIYS